MNDLRQLLCFLLFLNASTLAIAQNSLQPIGNWREHLSYQHCIQVVAADKIYTATDDAVFSVAGNELTRFTKVTGLNDMGIAAIAWDETTGQLVIAYTNSNVDLLKGSIVKNLGDIKRSNISANKSINQIFCNNGIAYLSAGLGVIVADLNKTEIKDTWYLGSNGSQIKVNGFNKDAQYFYAATDEGLKRASQQSSNLSNPIAWQDLSGTAGLTKGACLNVVPLNGKMVVLKKDSLLIQNNAVWSVLYTDNLWPIISVTSNGSELSIAQRKNDGSSRVLIMDDKGTIIQNFSKAGLISFPRNAIKIGSDVWVADYFGGLIQCNANFEQFIPNGPLGKSSGEMIFQNNHLIVAAGAVNDAWNYQYDRDGIFDYDQESWTYQGYYNRSQLDSVLDFITVTADPDDGSLWGGSYGGGLVHFQANNISIYKQKNSTLQAAIGDASSYRVSGLAFDQNKNLWISNYGASKNLQVRKNDGSWKAFQIPFSLTENATSGLLVDDFNQVFIISPKGNGFICYNPGNNIDALTDDKWKNYLAGSGLGNLPSNNVLCMAKDKNGFIWVGTDKGIGIIQCSSEIFSGSGCEALLPIVQQDRFAGLLFHDESVQCIAVDAANRKWVGTKNGLWLISADGDKIIYQFNTENSPLLNNDVKKIAINPLTGEVFIATFNGICSFRSTATEAEATNQSVLVFPNPVPPGYQGTIAIRGLANNALVKIAELNGTLVYQTRALGSQAIWDGNNYKGQKVASGVYLVIARDDSGNEKLVTKIVIIAGR
ncbi:MAG: two-component regulator propeller domain-containing protein [Bacteroidota bacterium]